MRHCLKSPLRNKSKPNLHILLLQEHVMEYSLELQKRPPPPHTNHDEIILLVGLERLVEAERLRLDSAQHGPGRGEESVGCGRSLGAECRVRSPHP